MTREWCSAAAVCVEMVHFLRGDCLTMVDAAGYCNTMIKTINRRLASATLATSWLPKLLHGSRAVPTVVVLVFRT